ncbi:inositol monophosphatase family protein, partial [Solibacillus silvestris]|uniref:inositol monophosphatase family protein n=1 Tax=Solibacillus silvestris TaxID=76853 RepID=UPI003F7EB0FA
MENIIKRASIIAKQAVIEAGNLAKSKFGQTYETDYKGMNEDLVTEIDIMAETIIMSAINKHFPTHRIQSEEMGGVCQYSCRIKLLNFSIKIKICSIKI